ncbi:DUF4129 domain-containing protein [Paenibacillus thalictri]|uniref:DUF4129 domain-containing protein n=1 Tax=Paenibacillus thalictri TaxID=2527873 RepID=A0A4Q9DNM5_9BACL|nr:DUF4129 domain-containing protein [Paenibacillus thalictri]TBL75387.1 DUF4129 domain-containing protein [Paenibacillus thalictri]
MSEYMTSRSLAKALLRGAVELLLFLPPFLLAAVYLLDGSLRWLWLVLLPVAYVVGYAAQSAINLRKLYALLLLAAATAAVHTLIFYFLGLAWYVTGPFALLAAFRGIRSADMSWEASFPVGLNAIGILIYFIVSVMVRFVESFQPYVPVLTGCGVIALAVALFIANQAHIRQETLSGKKAPSVASSVLWQNRMMIGLLLIVIAVVALFRELRDVFLQLRDAVIAAILWLLSLLPDTKQTPEGAAQPKPPMDQGVPAQPAAWLVWLEQAAIVLAEAAAVLLIVYGLYKLLRKLPPLVKRIYLWCIAALRMGEKLESREGYEDNVESLVDWNGLGGKFAERLKNWRTALARKKIRWEDLEDNGERVRFLYKRWLQRHIARGYAYKPFLTPQETGNELDNPRRHTAGHQTGGDSELVEWYEHARYGERLPTDAQAQILKNKLERANQE